METIDVKTSQRVQIVDITAKVQAYVARQKRRDGLVLVYCPHTTAAITVNENADPDVRADLTRSLSGLVPADAGYAHSEGNSDAHIKGTLTGFSQGFIVEDGRVSLGIWQGIYFMEYDGPRSREVWLQFVPTE